MKLLISDEVCALLLCAYVTGFSIMVNFVNCEGYECKQDALDKLKIILMQK